MSLTLLVSKSFGYLESFKDGNQLLDSSKFIARNRNSLHSGRFKKGKIPRLSSRPLNTDLRFSCLDRSGSDTRVKFSVRLSMVVDPAGEMVGSSEQKAYNAVLKQAALVKRPFRSLVDIVLPGTMVSLSKAYDQCGEICQEHAKTYYLGTLLMTRERQRAIWAIYAWGRRTDELVDGPNASRTTLADLDRWESRLENLFMGCPLDMFDAALSDTVAKFPIDIQPFKDMIEGMRMDLTKSRYKNFDELYLYCYYVAGTIGLMSVPVMGIAPESQAPTESVYNAALALGIANQLTNILRDVGLDAKMGRVYLPEDELAHAGLSDEDIFSGKVTEKWKNFMKKQIERARMFYNEAEKGVIELSSASRWPVWAALVMYRQILDEIEANDYDNFTKIASVSKPKKILALPIAYAKSLLSRSSTSSSLCEGTNGTVPIKIPKID